MDARMLLLRLLNSTVCSGCNTGPENCILEHVWRAAFT